MTVEEYRKSLEKLPHKTPDGRSIAEVMAESVQIWSNDSAKGYTIKAAKLAGLDPETISELISCMQTAFGDMTTDEAAAYFIDYFNL